MSEAKKSKKLTELQRIKRQNNSIHIGKQIDRLLPRAAGRYGNKLELLKELGFNSYQRYDYNVEQKDLSTATLRKVANGLGIPLYLLFVPAKKRKKVKQAVWNVENQVSISEGAVGNTQTGKGNQVQMVQDKECRDRIKVLEDKIQMLNGQLADKERTILVLMGNKS